jgi:hypothetical protein
MTPNLDMPAIYGVALDSVRFFLTEVEATTPGSADHDHYSFYFDRAASDLALIHQAMAEDWDLADYWRVANQRAIEQQSTREFDLRWARHS